MTPAIWLGQQHLVEARRHGEETENGADEQVVPAHVVQAGAGDRQGEEAEEAPLQGIERPGAIEGDGDHEQADREVHQVGVQGQGVGQPVRAKGAGQLLDRSGIAEVGQRHHTCPWRIASTTGTVWSP